MKLVSFVAAGKARWGEVHGDRVFDLSSRFATLREALAAGRVAPATRAEPQFALDEIRFQPPIPFPEKILCVGVNYAERNEEYKDGSTATRYPSIFVRFPGSFVGHRCPIVRPPESSQLDYEGEIAIVIGKAGRRIPVEAAERHIAGLTCLNEGTIRDWTRHGKFNVTQGKNWEASGAMGPWLVTADEFERYDRLQLTTTVNGEVRQHDTTSRLMFSFAFLIHYVSLWTRLVPGDVISTGTPTGAGVRLDPPRFLQPGDVVEVKVPGIGVLSNSVVDENPRA